MDNDEQPLSAARLARFRAEVARTEPHQYGLTIGEQRVLLREVERLQSQVTSLIGECRAGADDQNKLRAELLEALKIVRAVAALDDKEDWIDTDDYGGHGWLPEHIEPLIEQARALLAGQTATILRDITQRWREEHPEAGFTPTQVVARLIQDEAQRRESQP